MRTLALALLYLAAAVAAAPARADIGPAEGRDAVLAKLQSDIDFSRGDGGPGGQAAADCPTSLTPDLLRCTGSIAWAAPRSETCGGTLYVRHLPAGTLREQPEPVDPVVEGDWSCPTTPVPDPPAEGLTIADGKAAIDAVPLEPGTTLERADDTCARVDEWTVACRRITSRVVLGAPVYTTESLWASIRSGTMDVASKDVSESYGDLASAQRLYDLLTWPDAPAPAPPAQQPPAGPVPAPGTPAPGPVPGPPRGRPTTPKGRPVTVKVTRRPGRRFLVRATCHRVRCRATVAVRTTRAFVRRARTLTRGRSIVVVVRRDGRPVRVTVVTVRPRAARITLVRR
jgi:hypothetical protein